MSARPEALQRAFVMGVACGAAATGTLVAAVALLAAGHMAGVMLLVSSACFSLLSVSTFLRFDPEYREQVDGYRWTGTEYVVDERVQQRHQ